MAASITLAPAGAQDEDPYQWLEEVEGEKALDWVREQNKNSLGILEADGRFQGLMDRALKDYNATDKIAYGRLTGGAVHNFWQDGKNVRGLWRRTTMKSYKADNPNWITVLDFDELAKAENENWVYKGRKCLPPDFGRCLIEVSRGGGDAVVVREFDAVMKRFVDGGFVTQESKQEVVWVDQDTVLIGTNSGDGTMTDSGYANQVKLWKRNQPLEEAKLMHEGKKTDVGSFAFASHRPDGTVVGVVQAPDFFTEIIHVMEGEEMRRLEMPLDISFKGMFGNKIILSLRKDWAVPGKTVKAGSLVSVVVADAIGGNAARSISTIYEPDERSSIDDVSIGKDRIYLSVLEEVTGKLMSAVHTGDGWKVVNMGMPKNGSLSVVSADEWSDAAYINFESFLQPSTLYEVTFDKKPAAIKSLPARFDAANLMTEQKFATSKDGTKVPYFVIRPKDVPMDGTTPTILYGYGGFEISMTPAYMAGPGKLWLEQGGAYVIANIRGGGEFGPKWHQAALKANRQRAYDDFIAVGEDLIATKLTSPRRLGIRGGSNGGLLMGVMTTQRPDLWNAVICAVPLLDMMRFHTLLAGASWMGEYGDPDKPEERDFILKYSPYQNLHEDTYYPEVFFYTSTKDDRVHPGHARKMAARMMGMGKPVLYYENIEGGHSAAANLKQKAYTDALQLVYALHKLKD